MSVDSSSSPSGTNRKRPGWGSSVWRTTRRRRRWSSRNTLSKWPRAETWKSWRPSRNIWNSPAIWCPSPSLASSWPWPSELSARTDCLSPSESRIITQTLLGVLPSCEKPGYDIWSYQISFYPPLTGFKSGSGFVIIGAVFIYLLIFKSVTFSMNDRPEEVSHRRRRSATWTLYCPAQWRPKQPVQSRTCWRCRKNTASFMMWDSSTPLTGPKPFTK